MRSRPAVLVLFAVGLLGCSKPEPGPPAQQPRPTQAEQTSEPNATPPEPAPKPPAGDVAEPPKPPRPVRLMLRAPDGLPALERATLRDVTATIRAGGDVVAERLPVKLLAEAREGQAVMMLTVGRPPSSAEQWVGEILLGALGPRDRVAVGNLGPEGFHLVRGFSADTRSALASLKSLSGAPGDQPIPLLHGLHAALDAFRGQSHIPTLRALVVVSDGADRTIRRSSVAERVLAAIELRAYLHGVRIHAITMGSEGASVERLRALAEATGGAAVAADPGAPPTISSAARTLANALQRWIVIDADLGTLAPGEHDLEVSLDGAGDHPTRQRTIDVPERGTGRTAWDLEIPPAPERVLPVGVESASEVLAAARRAEQADDLLLAGALWHLALQANPESRAALTRTKTMDEKHAKAHSGWGALHYGGTTLPVDVRVRLATDLAAELWRKDLRRETPLSRVIGAVPEPATEGDEPAAAPPQSQIVLHRCQAFDARSCLRRLLAAGRATHLFVDAAGGVTQLVDLARPLADPHLRTPNPIHVHLAAPPDPAVVWQDPAHPETLRHVRRYQPRAEVNDVRVDGFDLTAAQYAALVPLLKGLTRHFTGIAPALPTDSRRRPTRRALVEPEDFNGLLLYSNAAHAIARDPTPALRLEYLADRVPRWSWRGDSANMESWLPDLAEPRRQEAAAIRFAHVGGPALPLLREVALELPPESARWAVEAMALIGDSAAEPTLVTLLARPLPDRPSAAVVDLRLATVAALVRVTAGASETLAAADQALGQALAVLPAASAHRDTLSRWTAALHLAADEAGVAGFVARSSHEDPVVRGQAILGLATHAKEHSALRQALTDREPWIRFLAARALEERDALLGLAGEVGREWVARALLAHNEAGVPDEVLDWLADPDPVTRLVVSDLLIARGGVDAVRALAPRLADLDEAGRVPVLRTLRGITKRDFGSAPDGYLKWAVSTRSR